MTANRYLPCEAGDNNPSTQKAHLNYLLKTCRHESPTNSDIHKAVAQAADYEALPELLYCRMIAAILEPHQLSHSMMRTTYYVAASYYETERQRYTDDIKLAFFCIATTTLALQAAHHPLPLNSIWLALSAFLFMGHARLFDAAADHEINRRINLPRDEHFQEALAAEYHTLREWLAITGKTLGSSTGLIRQTLRSTEPMRPAPIQTTELNDTASLYDDRSPTPVYLPDDDEEEKATDELRNTHHSFTR